MFVFLLDGEVVVGIWIWVLIGFVGGGSGCSDFFVSVKIGVGF